MTIAIDHTGRRALVTGAGAGIGREIARWLARAGATVAVNDLIPERAEATTLEINAEINAEATARTGAGSAIAVPADCRDDEAVDTLVATTVERLGGLDLAVNNVGMLPAGRRPQPFVANRGDDWRDIVDQNLIVAALCARAQAEAMLTCSADGRHSDGQPSDDRYPEASRSILFVTSGETTRPAPYNAVYAAAKAAVNHLVTTMAVELGPEGIRVNAMAPGTTLTETVAAAFTEERVAALVASTPLRRMVDHDELARLAVFLTSDLARCITGQFVLADAGAFLSRSRPANDEGLVSPLSGSNAR
jgi:NAD(P)-dependent dehydrogenase (short-subunit alcohol dehydrogenase family)